MSKLLDSALWYARKGWHVFPCVAGGKTPLTDHGFEDATTAEGVIRVWWTQHSDANIGVACGASGLAVIDVDVKDGKPGLDSWRDLLQAHGQSLGETVVNETPSNGMHMIYRQNGTLIHNSQDKLGSGIDTRGIGGYIVVPPSVTPVGEYHWALGYGPQDREPAAFPEALLPALSGPKAPLPVPEGGIAKGGRNGTLASLAGTMRRRGMSGEAIEAALLAENRRCVPPLPDDEVRKIARSVSRYSPAAEAPHLTDMGNARRLVARYGQDLRHCKTLGWLAWDGRRWAPDDTGASARMAKDVALKIDTETQAVTGGAKSDEEQRAAIRHWATSSESAMRQTAMLSTAETEPELATRIGLFDVDPWLLTCENGTLDLHTGELREHKREDFLTKLAPVTFAPDATDDILDLYLDSTLPDLALRAYVQRAVGYSLTGDTGEEAFFLVLGPPATGKSTLVEALLSTLGDYGAKANFETFVESSNVGGARPDLAALRGARFVAAVETSASRRLAEPLVKELVGGDTITVRHLYREPFSFVPSCKLWLGCNEAPKMRDDDSGLWRRLRRVAFEHEIPLAHRDPLIKAHLRADPGARSALLAWAVRGCLAWQRDGLGTCDSVTKRTAELRSTMDPLAGFLAECCIMSPLAEVKALVLRQAYEAWARENGARALGAIEWGKRVGAVASRTRQRVDGAPTTVWRGIGLRTGDSVSQITMDAIEEEIPL